MTSMTAPVGRVTGGVDTHADTHVAVVVDAATGHVAGTASFGNAAAGHTEWLGWMAGHDMVD